MNSNTSSTGRERRDRPGFGWAGRSAALALWIISVLLWCVLMRQSFNAMPWDEMTVAGTRLHEWRKPFAAAGMAVGVIGTGRLPGVPVLALPVFPDGSRVGYHAEAGAGGGLLGLFTRRSGAGGNGRLPDYRHLSGGGPLLGRGGYFLSRRPGLRRAGPG